MAAEKTELNILLVEDSEEDALLIKRLLENGQLRHLLFIVRQGEEALDFLCHQADYADERQYPRPDLVLLDLRLPGLSGLEVLERIKKDENLEDIPVAILTVSDEEEDIIRSYRAGARGYLLKSVALVHKAAGGQKIIDTIISLAW